MKRFYLWGGVVLLSVLATFLLSALPLSVDAYLHILFILSGNALFYLLSLLAPEKVSKKHKAFLFLLSASLITLFSGSRPYLVAFLPGLFFLLPDSSPIRLTGILLFLIVFLCCGVSPYTLLLSVLAFYANYVAGTWRKDSRRLEKTLYSLDEETQKSNVLNRRYLALEESQSLLQDNAILQERQRIARDIHDHVGHELTSAILQLKALEFRIADPSLLVPIRQLLEESMTEIRNSVHNLHDQSLNLAEEVQLLLDRYTYCPVYKEIHLQTEPPGAVHFTLLAAIKEALKNTATHSNATKAEILLSETPTFYRLLLVDNGTTVVKHPEAGNGLGLLSLQQRVDALNGSMNISVSNGFRLFITLPKEEV